MVGHVLLHEYYVHIQYNYSTQHQYFRWDNFHYSMYSKYCNTCWTALNSLLLNWFVAKYMFYVYSIFAELRDDCLGEAEKSFVRRLRNCYNKKRGIISRNVFKQSIKTVIFVFLQITNFNKIKRLTWGSFWNLKHEINPFDFELFNQMAYTSIFFFFHFVFC